MANIAWYNDNQFRDYPFIQRTSPIVFTAESGSGSSSASSEAIHLQLPHAAIVDFGAIMEIDAEYTEAANHAVYLHSLAREADTFTFCFRTNAPAAANHQLLFTRKLTDPEFVIEWEDAATITAEGVGGLACPIQPKWKGFLVTGNMASLGELLAIGNTWVFTKGLWAIEPARMQSLMDSYLRAINIANYPHLQVPEVAACEASSVSASTIEPVLNSLCMIGDVKWKEGFNCSIRQDNNNNAIVISAGVGAGEGEPCEEVPLFVGDVAPVDSPHLSGGPGCGDIVTSINGVTGSALTLDAGPGFQITADPVIPNKLILDKTLENFATCVAEDAINSSVSAGGG